MKLPAPFSVEDRVYTPTSLLGEGATARVYLASTKFGQFKADVAIKVRKEGGPISAAEFIEESARIKALRACEADLYPDSKKTGGTRFPRIFDVDPEGHFFVMERIQGRPLSQIFSEGFLLAPANAVHIAQRIGEALRVVSACGIAISDLKSDSIIWYPPTGRVTILDWNVVSTPEPAEWMEQHLWVTASYLDRLLAGKEQASEWSERITTPPPRWSQYYRAVQLPLNDLIEYPKETSLENFVETLQTIRGVLTDDPQNLIAFSRAQLTHARQAQDWEVRSRHAAQAAATAEIAKSHPGLQEQMLGADLQAAAEALASVNGQVIARLWLGLREGTGDGRFDGGESLEILRMQRLAGAAARVKGYGPALLELATLFADQRWAEAGKATERLIELLDASPEIIKRLQDLLADAQGHDHAFRGLGLLDEGRNDEAREALAQALKSLLSVRYLDAIKRIHGSLWKTFEKLPASEQSTTKKLPDKVAATQLRRQFARTSRVPRAGLAWYQDGHEVAQLKVLVQAWDAVKTASNKDLLAALTAALRASEVAGGCLPLARMRSSLELAAALARKHLTKVDAKEARHLSRQVGDVSSLCASLYEILAQPDDLSPEWAQRAQNYLAEGQHKFDEIADQALDALTSSRAAAAETPAAASTPSKKRWLWVLLLLGFIGLVLVYFLRPFDTPAPKKPPKAVQVGSDLVDAAQDMRPIDEGVSKPDKGVPDKDVGKGPADVTVKPKSKGKKPKSKGKKPKSKGKPPPKKKPPPEGEAEEKTESEIKENVEKTFGTTIGAEKQ